LTPKHKFCLCLSACFIIIAAIAIQVLSAAAMRSDFGKVPGKQFRPDDKPDPEGVLRRAGITSSFGFTVRDASGSVTRTFILTVWPEYSAPFKLQAKLDTPERITDATIWINEAKVIDSSDFANGVSEVTREVNLKAGDNIVRVEVFGPVKSGVWVFFGGTLNQATAQVFAETFYFSDDGNSITKTFPAHKYIVAPYELFVTRPFLNHRPTYPPIVVILNGRQIISPSDYQQDDASFIRREVDLLGQNTLEVQNLRGKPGTALGIKIRGKRAPKFPGPSRPLGPLLEAPR
jgi:hypothetical protein